jgi:predicted nucleotidyltransferase
MTKTAGVADVVHSALSDLRDQIELALIFGSWAKGTGQEGSDVDLLVVGSVSFQDVAVAASRMQTHLGREVNPVVYSADEFREKLTAKHHFVNEIVTGPKMYLIGDDHDLTGLGT